MDIPEKSKVIKGKIDHAAIHRLVRKNKDKLSTPVLKNLRKLITEIERILDGKDNVTAYIYISELRESICLQMGEGEKEIAININEDGIDHVWKIKNKTWLEMFQIKLTENSPHKAAEGLNSMLSNEVSKWCYFGMKMMYKKVGM